MVSLPTMATYGIYGELYAKIFEIDVNISIIYKLIYFFLIK